MITLRCLECYKTYQSHPSDRYAGCPHCGGVEAEVDQRPAVKQNKNRRVSKLRAPN